MFQPRGGHFLDDGENPEPRTQGVFAGRSGEEEPLLVSSKRPRDLQPVSPLFRFSGSICRAFSLTSSPEGRAGSDQASRGRCERNVDEQKEASVGWHYFHHPLTTSTPPPAATATTSATAAHHQANDITNTIAANSTSNTVSSTNSTKAAATAAPPSTHPPPMCNRHYARIGTAACIPAA